ncbi:MAG: PorT family protein [Armatimonadetes bacterium]|nr:PorT family protein [Armatimonadota bacterium]
MKKTCVFLVVFLAICVVLPASTQVNFGVLGGLNLANISMDPDEGLDFSNRTAFGFGVVLDYSLNESITLHLEPMYLQKGTNVEFSFWGEKYKMEIIAANLEIPVMLKNAFGTADIKPYVMAGPIIGFNLSAKAKNNGVAEEDIKDYIKNVEFGLGFGAGVNLPMGNNSIFLETCYAFGLTNVNDGLNPGTDIKTKGLQIFVGITFPTGKK